MNVGQAKTKIAKLIDNYSRKGTIINQSDTKSLDNSYKMNDYIDQGQKEIATVGKKIQKSFKISQYPVLNGLANPLYMFDIVEHTTSDIEYVCMGAKAYTFQVDNIADIYIKEQINGVWVDLPTPLLIQQTTKPDGYAKFRGFIVATNPSHNIKIIFSGSYEYRIRYIALFTPNFATVNDIPYYDRYRIYDLPSDYHELAPDGVVFKGNQSDGYPYIKTADYFFEYDELGNPKLAINYYNKGEYTIQYHAMPETIDDTTPDSQELANTLEAQELVPYYVAGQILLADNSTQNIGTFLMNMYETKLARLTGNEVYGQAEFVSTSGW